MDLNQFQSLLYKFITSPEALTAGLSHGSDLPSDAIEVVVLGDERLSARDRIDIYATAYFCRLLDCLHEEFPATLAVVGPDNFAALARDYLLQYPPSEPSINHAGRYLAGYLRNHRLARQWPFITELATLERAILDVFHAADAPTLSVEGLRMIPPQRWPELELRAHPAVRIVHGEWRVADVLSAVESGDEWSLPAHERAVMILWRQNAQVRYRDLREVEVKALGLVSQGASFAAICEAIATDPGQHDQTTLIGQMLARWLADEIILADTGASITS
jgi:Putative DNA-binding domain